MVLTSSNQNSFNDLHRVLVELVESQSQNNFITHLLHWNSHFDLNSIGDYIPRHTHNDLNYINNLLHDLSMIDIAYNQETEIYNIMRSHVRNFLSGKHFCNLVLLLSLIYFAHVLM